MMYNVMQRYDKEELRNIRGNVNLNTINDFVPHNKKG